MYKTLLSAAVVLLATIQIGLPTTAEAAIYKCLDAAGSISYSSAPCPAEDTTSAVLKNKRDNQEYVDCRIANLFTLYTAAKMKEGLDREAAYEEYGGIATLTRTASSIINFTYSFDYDKSVLPAKIARHSADQCQKHAFGTPSCDQFPDAFIEAAGGCEKATTSTVKTIDSKEDLNSPVSQAPAPVNQSAEPSSYQAASYNETSEPTPSYEAEEEEKFDDVPPASQTQNYAETTARSSVDDAVDEFNDTKTCKRRNQAEMRSIRNKLRGNITPDEQKALLEDFKTARAKKNAC